MSENEAIHSKKSITEHLSNLSFILGIISILVFVLSLFFKSTPVNGQAGSFFLDEVFITTICMIGNIASSVAIVIISLVYQKNFMRYHLRAVFGFFLAIIPIVLTAIAGK